MSPLYKVGRRDGHIVAQIVEAEFIVRSECNVGQISFSTFRRIRPMFVYTVHRQTIEHIKWAHPFRVTLGQIVVHRYDVDAVSCQRIKENRERCNQSFTLTCGHLGDLSLMESDSSEDLHVVMNHFPFEVVASGSPVIMVNRFVTVDGDEVVCWIPSQFAVKIRCRNHGFFILCKPASRIFDNAESNGHYLVQGFLINL